MTTQRSRSRAVAAVAATATAALILAACGGTDDEGSAPAKKDKHNAEDVTFAKGMIPHHQQAVEMADLAASRASSPKVKSLSEDIKRAQDPEIKKMSGWLKSWDEEVPEHMPGMNHGGDMPGMMSPEDMEDLKKASGKKFDSAFLEMMIEHHEGAIEMAKAEKSKGSYKAAKDMAGDIATSQNAEIKQMNTLLGK